LRRDRSFRPTRGCDVVEAQRAPGLKLRVERLVADRGARHDRRILHAQDLHRCRDVAQRRLQLIRGAVESRRSSWIAADGERRAEDGSSSMLDLDATYGLP